MPVRLTTCVYKILHVIVFHRGLGHAVGSERFDPGEGPKGASPCCVRSCAHSGYARREAPRDTCVFARAHTPEKTQGGARSSAHGARARASIDARVPLSPGRRRETPPRALTLGRPRNTVVIISDDAQGRRLYLFFFFFSFVSRRSRKRGLGTAGRTSNDRSYAQYAARDAGSGRDAVAATRSRESASSMLVLKRPSARRGPGIVSVDRNVRSKCRCSCVLQFTS